ncbi:sel1 repeat family protein, partial [Francisella philomiragia]|uniref:sel1 repeat family protein n=1 Tax=Francisella philomiragia TaxID=28110 RepID=UPI0019057C5E|nr:sel1 repeat family protein [Francisella philomiragia]
MKTRDKSVILNLFQNLTIKTITATALIGVSTTAFASLSDCMYQARIQSKSGVLKECLDYVNKDPSIMAMVFSAYAAKKNNIEAMKYSKMYIKEYGDYKSNADDISFLASAYSILGNIYYFGEAEPKYPKDTTKGIEYITKGAKLGSPIAQEQLGSIYGSDDGTV